MADVSLTWRGFIVFCFILLGIPAIGVAAAEWLRASYIESTSFASQAVTPTSVYGEGWRYVLDAFRTWRVHSAIYGHCTNPDNVVALGRISAVSLAIGAIAVIAVPLGRHRLAQNRNFETTARSFRLVIAAVVTASTFVLPGVVLAYGICVVGGIVGRKVYYAPIIIVAIGWLAFVWLVMRAAFFPESRSR